MSYRLTFAYVRTVLEEQGPLTADEIKTRLSQFHPEFLDRVLSMAVSDGDLSVAGGVYHLAEDGPS